MAGVKKSVIAPVPPRDGGEWEHQCARCGSCMIVEECWACRGEGLDDHDCGDDTCCCLRPEENVDCSVCDGCGNWPVCLSSAEWCEAHPMPGRENVTRGRVEWFTVDRVDVRRLDRCAGRLRWALGGNGEEV